MGVVEKEGEEYIIHWLLMRRDGVSAHAADIEAIHFLYSPAVKSQRLGFLLLTLPGLKFGTSTPFYFFIFLGGRRCSRKSERCAEAQLNDLAASVWISKSIVLHTEGKHPNLALSQVQLHRAAVNSDISLPIRT